MYNQGQNKTCASGSTAPANLARYLIKVSIKRGILRSKTTLGWLLTLIATVAQALAYYYALPLSLGPRVILQPWLMQQGYLIYEHIADEHTPLMYLLLLAVQPLISNGLLLAKIVLISLISMTTLLTFWAAARTGGWLAGVCSVLFFTIWSPIFGYGKLWHETFLAPLYILLLIQWRPPLSPRPNARSSLIAGFLLGLALLVKQHALAVILSLILWEILVGWHTHRPAHHLFLEVILFVFAASLPIAAFAGYHLLKAGTVKNLVFWTVTFNFVNDYKQLASLSPKIAQLRFLAPAYFLLPPFTLHLLTSKDNRTIWSSEGWALVLLIASCLTAYPRFGYFHLQASLPILAWLSGTTLARLLSIRSPEVARRPPLIGLICSLILLWALHAGIPYYSALHDNQPRGIREYTDLVPLASEIRRYIGPTDCIYILPDDEATANLYYLVECKPPKFWIPTSYPWFMLDMLKPKIIQTLEQASPEWVVYFPGRWGIEQHGQEIVTYVQSKYQLETKLSWAEGEVWLLQRQFD